jgi:hypothetical protein
MSEMEYVHRDAFGAELFIGDAIIFTDVGYEMLRKGQIIKLLPKHVRIGYEAIRGNGPDDYYEVATEINRPTSYIYKLDSKSEV